MKNTNKSSVALPNVSSLAPGVKWTVDIQGIILMNDKEIVHHIYYPEAAIWDFVSRGYPLQKIIPLLCSIASLEAEQAEQLILAALEKWCKSGFLIQENING